MRWYTAPYEKHVLSAFAVQEEEEFVKVLEESGKSRLTTSWFVILSVMQHDTRVRSGRIQGPENLGNSS